MIKNNCLDCGKETYGKRCTKCCNMHHYKIRYPRRIETRINPDNENGLWRYKL